LITVLGAGSVGLALGARLAHAGHPVRFVVRRAEAAARLSERGVGVEDPATGARWRAPVPATNRLDPAAVTPPLLLCVRVSHGRPLAAELGERAPQLAVACFQNDVETEERVARHVATVIGAVWRQTCTRVDDEQVRFSGAGRVVLGLYPEGGHPLVERLASWLRSASFDVGVSGRIVEDKWLKLCVNLMSAPNALVRRADHTDPAFVEIKVRLLEEAAAALTAAGITARSCDGRDRSIAEEIAFQRASLERGTSARAHPLYNQVWSSLRTGAPLEADAYHRRIAALARRHGLAAPANERVLRFLEEVHARRLGPESVGAAELLGREGDLASGG
jgi:2-dehydropantoate 2-reductase